MNWIVALYLTGFLVSQKATVCTQSFNPTLTFEPASHFLLEDDSILKYDVSAVTRFTDVNGDGYIDMIVASNGYILLHLGIATGRFQQSKPIKTQDGQNIDTGHRGNRETSMAYSDMNKDGAKDILICKGKELYVYTRTGTDHGLPIFGSGIYLGTLEYNRFDVIDWDSDGNNDIIIGTFHGEFKIYHILNQTLSDATRISLPKSPSPYNLYPRTIDITRDGVSEIIYSINWGYFTILTNASNEYKSFKLYLDNSTIINVRPTYGEHQAPELADVDGDGVMDLITSGDTGDIVFFRGINNAKRAQENILNTLSKYPANLGYVMENNSAIYNTIYDSNRELQHILNYEIYPPETKTAIFIWYLHLVTSYPQYFSRQKWEQPCLASLAGYVWIILLESQPDSHEHWRLISAATRHSGYAGKLLEDRGIVLINNDGESEDKIKMIYDFIMMKDPDYYSLSSISQNSFLDGKLEKYTSIRHSGVNIFSGAEFGHNMFPEDCQVCKEEGRSPSIYSFLAALAHEVSHNELDQESAKAFNKKLFTRKYEILKRASKGHVVWKEPITLGYDLTKTKELFRNNSLWDGLLNWDETFENLFDSGNGTSKNSIRPFNMAFFVKYPQEAFATLANEYASDSKLMLDFAIERARQGYTLCVDWFLLMADYYTKGGTNIPILQIDSKGNMNKSEATVSRDINGYINHVTFDSRQLGPTEYNCELDEEGFVISCSSV